MQVARVAFMTLFHVVSVPKVGGTDCPVLLSKRSSTMSYFDFDIPVRYYWVGTLCSIGHLKVLLGLWVFTWMGTGEAASTRWGVQACPC